MPINVPHLQMPFYSKKGGTYVHIYTVLYLTTLSTDSTAHAAAVYHNKGSISMLQHACCMPPHVTFLQCHSAIQSTQGDMHTYTYTLFAT